MRVCEVLHMNGGVGDSSYSKNSILQKKGLVLTKPIAEKAINDTYTKLKPDTVSIADLGCSSGANAFSAVSDLIKVIHHCAQNEAGGGLRSPEYNIYLNDLPGNDFNTIFGSWPQHLQDLKKEMGEGFDGECFCNGVPGSFYERLFPTNSLHFVHSSYSLMWLSQVPRGAEENKRNVYLAPSTPPCVVKAYYEQFERDFGTFIKCRAKELVAGGGMVLTIAGRKSEDPRSRECCHLWEILGLALSDLVDQGLIEEEKLNTFNIPYYTPSPAEVKHIVENKGSFSINSLEVTYVHCDPSEFVDENKLEEEGYNVAKCFRAISEPLLLTHFGEGVIEKIMHQYRKRILESLFKGNIRFYNVVVTVTKKM
ncbi:hypothetical protein DM860_001608 [Cuscuta australis]|uniref:Uncharacterized protein n=1 Tax=Cuscuta australis TaxID=267555 RepID=A0A328EA40_9ASTE|nr:hypothetical protein DM860_001608 [Cuscuta australis]